MACIFKSADKVRTDCQRIAKIGDKMRKGKAKKANYFNGAPGRIRTCDLRIRSPLLYPTELQALNKYFNKPNTTIIDSQRKGTNPSREYPRSAASKISREQRALYPGAHRVHPCRVLADGSTLIPEGSSPSRQVVSLVPDPVKK